MRRRNRTAHGFTLPEVMMSMVIMALIGGVVSAVYSASMQVWRRCSSQSQADPPAHMAVHRLTKELKNAYEVTAIGDALITFHLPATDADGINTVPLTAAKEVSYYLSDATGARGLTGTVLWRDELDLADGHTNLQRLADNVQTLQFDCEATSERVLSIYTLSIVVLGREGRQVYQSEFGSHVAFRN